MKLARLSDPRFHAALNKLSAQPVPLRVAFKLKGVQVKVQEELKKWEECRMAALQKYATKGEDGKAIINPTDNTYTLTKENMEEFGKELNELGQTDLEMAPVKLTDLGDKAELSTDDVAALSDIIVE